MYLRDGKLPFDGMHEECGVFGVYSNETRDVAHTLITVCTPFSTEDRSPAGSPLLTPIKCSISREWGLFPKFLQAKILQNFPKATLPSVTSAIPRRGQVCF